MTTSATAFQLPQQNIPVVDAQGRVTLQWFRFFQQLGVSGDPSGAIAALEAEVATLATDVATAESQAAQAVTDASEALDAASAGQVLGAIALKQAVSPLRISGSGLATSGASSITFAGAGATVSHEGGDVTVTVPATVYSVGLSAPAQFSVTGSPVATSGTLNFSWNTQTANAVLAGPSSGSAAAPTFRALVAADIPENLNASIISGFCQVNYGSANPYFQWYNSSAGTNQKYLRLVSDSIGDLILQTVNDAYTAAISILKIDNSGNLYLTSAGLKALTDQGAWSTYSPTVSSGSGSITSYTVNSARYLQLGTVVHLFLSITINTNGTGAGAVIVTLPVSSTSLANAVGAGRETSLTGKMCQAILTSATTAEIVFYDNTYPGANGAGILLSMTYEAAAG